MDPLYGNPVFWFALLCLVVAVCIAILEDDGGDDG